MKSVAKRARGTLCQFGAGCPKSKEFAGRANGGGIGVAGCAWGGQKQLENSNSNEMKSRGGRVAMGGPYISFLSHVPTLQTIPNKS